MASIPYVYLRRDWVHLLAVFALCFCVYLWSLPRTVVLEDDGYFILAAYYNAVTHPPGFPLFVFLSHFFTWIPAGSVAFRVHMASACFGAMGCIAVWILMRHIVHERIYAYVAALSLGFSLTYWSQAIIAEVYTLNVLLFVVLAILALRCGTVETKKRGVLLAWMAFLYGLALSNHWPLIVLSTPALLVLLWPVIRDAFARGHILIFCCLAGLLPYAWLVWRSHAVPEISFYGPIQTWHDFWFYVSRKPYANVDNSLTAGIWDKWRFALYALTETARQFGMVGIFFTVAGFIRQWRTMPMFLAVALTLAYAGNTLLLIALLDFDYEPFRQYTYQAYPLIAYTVAAIWLACGIDFFSAWLSARVKTVGNDFAVRALTLLVIGGALFANFPHNLRAQDTLAADYARAVLHSLEPDAIYYSAGDNTDGPLEYLNRIEKVRPDVSIFTTMYFVIDEKLYRPFQLPPAELRALFNGFIKNTERPIYYTNDFPNDYAWIRYGFYSQVDKTRMAPAPELLIIRPEFLGLLQQWEISYRLTNTWDRWHYLGIKADFCELVLGINYFMDASTSEPLSEAEKFTCTGFYGVLKRIKYALNSTTVEKAYFDRLFQEAGQQQHQARTKEELANLYYYQGMASLRFNDHSAAQAYFDKSRKTWPHPDNPSPTMPAGQ